MARNILSFPIRLPDNPLKWLNCYVIRGENGGRDLLIDTGFNCPECFSDLENGMRELNMDCANTDVFFTHCHADHTGNAAALQKLGCRLLMGRKDYEHLTKTPWQTQLLRMEREGVPPGIIDELGAKDPNSWMVSGPFTAELFEEGDILRYGGYELRCIVTPGHTPGHICLYSAPDRLMLTGDHVLFDVTPNITAAAPGIDSLGSYMESLKKIAAYPVSLALPGHRTSGDKSFHERVGELYRHHLNRLAEAERIVAEHPGINAYDAAGLMSWQIRARDWEDFPLSQKWFATGEALAHLVHLVYSGKIENYVNSSGGSAYRKI